MVPADVAPTTGRRLRAPIVAASVGVVALTSCAAVVTVVDPSLAGHTAPHPTLAGTPSDAAGILVNNARVLSAPFIAILLGFPASRIGRQTGDSLALLVAAASSVPIGIALGRWRDELLPYVPQLPLEWAALIVALAAWLHARRGQAVRRDLVVLAVTAAALLMSAAAIETWCTPHRRTTTPPPAGGRRG